MQLAPVLRWKSHNWKPRFRERMPSRRLQAVLVANFLRCSTDISRDRASSDGQTHVSVHYRAAFLPLAFSLCIACGGSCGVVVEVVEDVLRGDGKSYCRAKALFLRPKGK